MEKCFVIQPYDKKFDSRYNDIYAKAISKVHFEPYRVDQDDGAEIPIETINNEIKKAHVVLADISLDNPNVWFEIGLAKGYSKKIVFVCDTSIRSGKVPFDIQHISIINYQLNNELDYQKLRDGISKKLKSYSDIINGTTTVVDSGEVHSERGITDESFLVLGILANLCTSLEDKISKQDIFREMNLKGYKNIAIIFAIKKLEDMNYIINKKNYFMDSFSQEQEEPIIEFTSEGISWIENNLDRFQLTEEPNLCPF